MLTSHLKLCREEHFHAIFMKRFCGREVAEELDLFGQGGLTELEVVDDGVQGEGLDLEHELNGTETTIMEMRRHAVESILESVDGAVVALVEEVLSLQICRGREIESRREGERKGELTSGQVDQFLRDTTHHCGLHSTTLLSEDRQASSIVLKVGDETHGQSLGMRLLLLEVQPEDSARGVRHREERGQNRFLSLFR
jgi:hypothetical protein